MRGVPKEGSSQSVSGSVKGSLKSQGRSPSGEKEMKLLRVERSLLESRPAAAI
jgi:hypothetical protein